MRRRALPALAAAVLFLVPSLPALAQDEEEIFADIERIHGNADAFFEVFSLIQEAMQFGDPVTVAANASYPLTIRANGEVYELSDEEELVDNFETLVSVETQQGIAGQDVNDLIVVGDGVGIANGAVYLNNLCLDDDCSETVWAITAINN